MHTAAATATDGGLPPGTGSVVLVVTALALLYLASCAWWPFANCWCCGGSGRHSRGDRKVFRNCRWCRGSGRKLRLGRRFYNRIAKARRDGAK